MGCLGSVAFEIDTSQANAVGIEFRIPSPDILYRAFYPGYDNKLPYFLNVKPFSDPSGMRERADRSSLS